jgi:kynurenine 3-monooxygenase
VLVEAAARFPNVTLNFEERCTGASVKQNAIRFSDGEPPHQNYELPLGHTIATDGAGSIVRTSLAAEGALTFREDMLDHDYKELTIPAVDGKPAMEVNALHVWPRGGYMLIALPNPDASFTATLFLSRKQFAELGTPEAVHAFFSREFPDAVPLMPALLTEFFEHPQGQLGTIHTSPWHVGNKVLLMGDAAHAIVPFHGQGMNAAFEDCLVFDTLFDEFHDWGHLFAEFDGQRRPNADAIAQMALENYIEMRDTVLDPRFQRHKAMSVELEKRFPDRFIPRYSMVMFHPEISYADALRRGQIQEQILAELDAGDAAAVDFERAAALIQERLPPL